MNRSLVVVSHTHWDREWYQPFEAFRARLVRMMDALLDLLDSDPEYKHFAVDGQTVPLDDYLEIRPDRRADIERLVRAGRLLIGPNYMLPDEFLIGGEAHIRNLMTGIRSAREYGRVMMVGYAPDAFGHITHLPAILRGFGIDSVLIWRGVGDEATTSEFRWAAPDGSEVLAIHFPHGYGMLPALPEDRETLAAALQNLRNMLEPFATTGYILVPNGTDHLPAHTGLSKVIRTANELLDDAEIVHGSYPMFVESVRRELGDLIDSLPRLEGEFRSSRRSNILPGVLSTRIWLKQRYQECEDLLARYAEPLVTWANLLRNQTTPAHPEEPPSEAKGRLEGHDPSTRGLLRHAWKLLLQNGPHDSVTGCSVDAVYTDVGARFDRCQQIAESLIYDAQRYIADRAARPGEQTVVVFNSENGPRTDFCTIRLPLEGGKIPLRLVDANGREVQLQITERGLHAPQDARERGFVAPEVPPFDYRSFRVEYNDTLSVGAGAGRGGGGQHAAPNGAAFIETDLFHVEAGPEDGTLSVTDKHTGATYTGLNRFVDDGDRGDEYNYCPPASDDILDKPAAPPQIGVIERGPARQSLQVRMTYRLPTALSGDRHARSDDRVDCDIVTRVSLYPGVPRIDIETEVENRAQDHRLRVHFPTGIVADHTFAEQHFGVVQRPVAVSEDDGTWFETPVGTYPQKSFVDVSDSKRGLMIANRGLPEYQALQEADGTITIALTLLRCVGWLSRADLSTRKTAHAGPGMETPGAQMPGRWKFNYSIIPHEGRLPAGRQGWQNAYAEAHNFVRPLRAIRVSGRAPLPAHPEALEGRAEPQRRLQRDSFLEIEPPELALSTLKPAEDGGGTVLRVYNIADEPVQGRVRLNAAFGRVERVNLNEEEPQPLDASAGNVELSLRPNEIVTLKFT